VLAPFALDLILAPALQAYVEQVFSVCGNLTSGKHNRLMKKLEKCMFWKITKKYYDI